MKPRLLLIGETDAAIRCCLNDLEQAAPQMTCEQVPWDGLQVDRLGTGDTDLILLSALHAPARAEKVLRTAPIGRATAPMIAILRNDTDADLIRLAAEFADDFVVVPLHDGELHYRILRLLGHGWSDGSGDETSEIKERLARQVALSGLVGRDPAFLKTLAKIPLAARCGKGPVLVTGETGTGKELCARAIHSIGPHSAFPFIPVDCATLPDHLFENEVFGHVSGAFTDARHDQKGLVALAEGGTLFLDEIDSLSLTAQSKLLRLLQERTYRPLGSSRFLSTNVAIIAASNCDLEGLVHARQFRADLYFRLNVLRLDLVPLRERRGDIPLLARHFLASLCAEADLPRKILASCTLRKLTEYDWPGNVRELHNAMRRAALFSEGSMILATDIAETCGPSEKSPNGKGVGVLGSFRIARTHAIERFEKRYVEDLMRECGGNVSQAARIAEKDRRAFGRLVKRYGVDRDYPGH
ncbi:sigma-54 interaction domain-containing protein [Nitrospirillum iridis]|uniref:DNA-binding NtrC family response regulator n=1 Tax=Nitrospirillum iridis TaxID=765888 RepID=A0A7X0EFK6_9PROT|nr:sigma-54 dependent transcriptional regulator [Nitrospirillum iridis]MBB6253141.1 DNA-binding NtrC family response regulator [Nitrospirillum iridis]